MLPGAHLSGCLDKQVKGSTWLRGVLWLNEWVMTAFAMDAPAS